VTSSAIFSFPLVWDRRIVLGHFGSGLGRARRVVDEVQCNAAACTSVTPPRIATLCMFGTFSGCPRSTSPSRDAQLGTDVDAPASGKSSIFLRRIIGSMFMRVNSKCAHQVRPPLG